MLQSRLRLAPVVLGFLLAGASPVLAGYTTIDIGGLVNSNVSINLQTFPTGTTTGNQGTSIPFTIATYGGSGYAGTWLAAPYGSTGTSLTITLTSLNITGQASFYALLNNYYGTLNANEYDITIATTNSNTVTYHAIGGVDTRDYNQNVNTSNTIANTTAPWFDNGLGQRLDVRAFTLPTSFAAETIASFTITQIHGNDAAMFSGLTFSDSEAISLVPEPATLAVLGLGLAGLGLIRRRTR